MSARPEAERAAAWTLGLRDPPGRSAHHDNNDNDHTPNLSGGSDTILRREPTSMTPASHPEITNVNKHLARTRARIQLQRIRAATSPGR